MVIDFSPFYDFHSSIDKFFDDLFAPQAYSSRRAGYPFLNISEDNDRVIVRAEMPGMDMSDIEITLHDSSLSIKGERKAVEGKYYRQERPSGVFQRVLSINAPIAKDGVAATLRNGILEITLPKAEETKPRKISIEQ